MKIIGLALLAMAASLPAFAAASPIAARGSQNVQHWSPTPYTNSTRLPADYNGVNVKRLYRLLAAQQKKLKKGEYETTNAYRKRLRESINLVPGIDPNANYALLLRDVHPKYDADTQQYILNKFMFCQFSVDTNTMDLSGEIDINKSTNPKDVWFVCPISQIIRHKTKYAGSNAFGVSTTVVKERGKNLGIAVRRNSDFIQSSLFKHDSRLPDNLNSSYTLNINFPYPISKAKELGGMHVSVLIVGRFSSSELISSMGSFSAPTIDNPYDTDITMFSVPFTPNAVVFFVKETGKVIATLKI